ncbi:TetR/AcrR family transcriptional regulator [Streptacidiphilus monticola]
MRPDQATAAATVPAPKAKRMPRAQREQLMLDAAVSVFAKSGYHSASMDEIAEAGGVSKPMLYLYLGSKEELFAACLRREAGGLVAAFRDAAAPQLPPGDQLFGGLVAFFRFVGERRDSWALLNQHARSSGVSPSSPRWDRCAGRSSRPSPPWSAGPSAAACRRTRQAGTAARPPPSPRPSSARRTRWPAGSPRPAVSRPRTPRAG